MRVLFVASECAPFVKTGGLADVIGSLPLALEGCGTEIRILLPAYPSLSELASNATSVAHLEDFFGGQAEIKSVTTDGLHLLLLVAPHLYDRAGGLYLTPAGRDWPDNYRRFAALSFAGAEICSSGVGDWVPEVVHVHDWQTGLLPAYLSQRPDLSPPVVMTIHNIAYQGLVDRSHLSELRLDKRLYTTDGLEYYGEISCLKAGITFSQKITTVSSTYADEILTSDMGFGLEGLLRARRDDLIGILNGIDVNLWNPETDAALGRPYSVRSHRRKRDNKFDIETRFQLRSNIGPLFCVISRLTQQKGIDLLLTAIPRLMAANANLIVLGSGDQWLEQQLQMAASEHCDQMRVVIGFDETMAHMLLGASDAILIPSRFEPCGLTQLYGLRYGAIPIVARTGGLADTIIDANHASLTADCATGIQFAAGDSAAFEHAINRCCKLYQNPSLWSKMIGRAMRHSVGWDQSAADYHHIYTDLVS